MDSRIETGTQNEFLDISVEFLKKIAHNCVFKINHITFQIEI